MDAWTSPNSLAFLGITAHWIDTSWNLRNVLLDFVQLHGSYSGENIAEAFHKSLNDYNLTDKVIYYSHLLKRGVYVIVTTICFTDFCCGH